MAGELMDGAHRKQLTKFALMGLRAVGLGLAGYVIIFVLSILFYQPGLAVSVAMIALLVVRFGRVGSVWFWPSLAAGATLAFPVWVLWGLMSAS